MNLTDKIALVTGASSGIGRATAFLLGRSGAKVCVNSWGDEKGAQNVARHLQENGSDSFQIQADVSDEEQAKNCVDTVLERWGRIDILVN
ncbi:SDR family NAD(P)-dependent oxidoreductase, partial [bacterium]|nr:SDR family NAD(P)-dependent oxidoreductase [bacterium]